MAGVLTIDLNGDRVAALAAGRAVLDRGGLLGFPTETVYGVGCRADRPEAVRRLRKLKDRTDGKPFTVHIGSVERVGDYVPRMPAMGRRLARKGWPGPLTLLFEVGDPSLAPVLVGREAGLAAELYHRGVIGVRCPDHASTCELLTGVDGPVVAASANRAGHPPALTAAEASDNLGDELDLLLDGGPPCLGKASTVVRVGENGYEMVREGVYDECAVRRLATMMFLFVCTGNTCRSPMAAGLFRKMLAGRLGCSVAELADRHVSVVSAGTFAGEGSPPTAEALEVMREHDVDLIDDVSTRLSAELIEQADRIYAMTRGHLKAVTAIAPSAEGKVELLRADGDIQDPIGGGVAVYAACAARIKEALTTRLGEVEL